MDGCICPNRDKQLERVPQPTIPVHHLLETYVVSPASDTAPVMGVAMLDAASSILNAASSILKAASSILDAAPIAISFKPTTGRREAVPLYTGFSSR